MKQSEFERHQILSQVGIDETIISLLPFTVEQVQRVAEDCCCCGNNALWIYRGREEDFTQQQWLLSQLRTNGVSGFLYPQILKNGSNYQRLSQQEFFYCTAWGEMRQIVFHELNDLRGMVRLLTDFRGLNTKQGESTVITAKQNLIEQAMKLIAELKSFELLARYRLNSTRFDYLANDSFDKIKQQAIFAVELLKNSAYQAKCSEKHLIVIIISRINLRVDQTGQTYFLRLNNFSYEVPCIDFAVFFNKIGRFIGWNFEWFQSLLADYQEKFPLDKADLYIIYAYLVFPWNILRLMRRYYFNYVNWPLALLVERLERLLADELPRQSFLEILLKKI